MKTIEEMTTIEELLEHAEVYTKEKYLKEKAEVEQLIEKHFGIKPEDIDQAMREHKIPHCHLDNSLEDIVDRWLSNEAFRPYLE